MSNPFEAASSLIVNLNDVQSAHFKSSPSKVCKGYLAGYSTSLANKELKQLKDDVLDLSQASLDLLRETQNWVSLLLPKVEDGGNFGVQIQMGLVKRVKEELEAVEKIYDSVGTWYEKRGGALAKVEDQVTEEAKENTVIEAVGEDKTGTSKSSSKTTKKGQRNEDNLEALANIDLKLFLDLKKSVGVQRSGLLAIQDFVKKNEGKIVNPRNTAQNYMY